MFNPLYSTILDFFLDLRPVSQSVRSRTRIRLLSHKLELPIVALTTSLSLHPTWRVRQAHKTRQLRKTSSSVFLKPFSYLKKASGSE